MSHWGVTPTPFLAVRGVGSKLSNCDKNAISSLIDFQVMIMTKLSAIVAGARRRRRARPRDGAAESARPIARNLDCTSSEKSEEYGSLIGPKFANRQTTWGRVDCQFQFT